MQCKCGKPATTAFSINGEEFVVCDDCQRGYIGKLSNASGTMRSLGQPNHTPSHKRGGVFMRGERRDSENSA